MNVRDSEVVAGLLQKAGYTLIDEPVEADVMIFNTCSVRQHAEDKVWSEIGRIAKGARRGSKQQAASCKTREHANALTRKPIIGLIGCMAQNYKEQIFERSPAVDFVAGPSDIDKIPKIIERVTKSQGQCASLPEGDKVTSRNLYELKIWETDGQIRPEEIYHTGYYEDKEHVYVVISEGCANSCSYCVVPYVRGALRNRNYEDILREIEEAIAKGITKITLLGQNVNAYKSPGQCASLPEGNQVTRSQVNFRDLLKMVDEMKGLEEFSFITSHPKDTTVELFKAMAECGKLKKYLHLPVQSGSDKILKMMNRGYTRRFYLDLADNYRKIVKDGALSTDIMVGFPGETEADFQDTYNLIKEIRFESAYIFKYSPRPHTEVLKWDDDVPKQEKERRHKLILDLQKKISISKKTRC